MSKNKAITLLGANGFPVCTYKPITRALKTTYGFDLHPIDVYDCAHGKNRNLAIEKLIKTIERLGKPVIGFGHSLGGLITYKAALRRPELFETIILFEPPLFDLFTRLVMMVFLPIAGAGKFHPLVASTYRKKEKFQSISEAETYFKSRKLYSKFDAKCLQAFLEGGIEPSGVVLPDDPAGGFQLKIIISNERFYYFTIPNESPGIFERYQNTTVPGYFIYSSRYEFLKKAAVDALKKDLTSLNFIGKDVSHLFPFENPSEMLNILEHMINGKAESDGK